MRILWFTNTSGLISGNTNASGGWISSLQSYLEKSGDYELGMVFYSDYHKKPFRQGGTHYFPVVRKGNTRWKRKVMQVTGRVEREENMTRFREIIEQFNPQLIHIHGTENPFGLIQEQTDLPVLISIQGILNPISHKYFSGVNSYRFSDWRKNWDFFLAKNYSIFKKKADIERRIFRNAQFLAGRTDWDRRVSGLLAPQAHYYHIGESLRAVFYQEHWQPPADNSPFRIFTTLSDHPYKGVHMLLESAIELHRSGFRFEWEVAGIGWDADMLRLFHRESELREVPLKLLGRLDENSMVEHLKQAHCFVQVSQIENSPNSLAEAMLLGLPCIATAVGGTFSMLQDGTEGLLVPEGDPFSLAGTVRELSAEYEAGIRMGTAARARALERHDPEQVMDELMRTYEQVLNRKK